MGEVTGSVSTREKIPAGTQQQLGEKCRVYGSFNSRQKGTLSFLSHTCTHIHENN